MKTYKERTKSILKKANKKRMEITAIGGSIACFLIILGLSLIPYDTTPPSMEQYAASEYYPVIQKMNLLNYTPPTYKNPLEKFMFSCLPINKNSKGEISLDFGNNGDLMGGADFAPMGTEITNNSQAGSEAPGDIDVTDNQVAGVIEGDRFKRSDSHIFYIRDEHIIAFSIEGENSKAVGSFSVKEAYGYSLKRYENNWEIFLSPDYKTLTLVSTAYNSYLKDIKVVLISIDVSDPANMTETARTYLSGTYLSARMIGDELLVMSNYRIYKNQIDFDDPTTFIPEYGTESHMQTIDASNIVAPEKLTNMAYTVVCKVDVSTLEAKSTGAFLSYSNEVYVSKNNIYASREYNTPVADTNDPNRAVFKRMTEISALSYSGDTFEPLGMVSVEGEILNQYSMDEYEGILRVVTTTTNRNASLYCISLDNWKVVASVENFAPEGETVRSVRYDGTAAYVCTAYTTVVELHDPVYFFDLSDLDNITYKDTGTIEGFSSSLVNFGDVLLGIGYGEDWNTLKIEIYAETDTSVESICSYEVPRCEFSEEYKSYLIDRKNMRLGLGYSHLDENGSYEDCYVLLQFDGYNLIEVVKAPVTGNHDYIRAVIIDEYLYIFGDNFVVEKL
ncbi:MAG: beta-propeller domain-containing protein [Agathobacter sp.]|nr:beta-propeller domain-containing protein [Agathobacter sp.]